MAIRIYLLPLETGTMGMRIPKYLAHRQDPDPPALVDAPWRLGADYGLEPCALFGVDVTSGQHQLLAAQEDVAAVPLNLDNTVGSARDAVVAKMEGFNVPAQWVASGATWRQTVRALLAIFRVAQRFHALGASRIVPPGVTLSTTYAEMPDAYRDALVQAIDELGYDRTGLTAQSTLRDLLTAVASQGVPETVFGLAI